MPQPFPAEALESLEHNLRQTIKLDDAFFREAVANLSGLMIAMSFEAMIGKNAESEKMAREALLKAIKLYDFPTLLLLILIAKKEHDREVANAAVASLGVAPAPKT